MHARRLLTSLCPCILMLCIGSTSLHAHADNYDHQNDKKSWGGNDDDTILIEKEANTKISYSRAIKAACRSLLGLDIDQYFSGGKNKRSSVIRQLNDLAERTHYRLRLEQEQVTFNFTLNL